MGFLLDKCSFSPLDEKVIAECRPFSCGNADLDEFFQHDAPLYSKQMLGKSYCFRLDEDSSVIVCAFTLSNDSIRVDMLPNSREKKVRKNIPRSKQMRSYPGVLIGPVGHQRRLRPSRHRQRADGVHQVVVLGCRQQDRMPLPYRGCLQRGDTVGILPKERLCILVFQRESGSGEYRF